MASLGALVIELAANTARLQGDLGKAVGMAERAAGQFKRVFGGLAAAGGGLGLAAIAGQAISLGDELQKGALRAGVSAGEFSKLAAAAKQADVDMGTLSRGLKEMQKTISEAASGSKSATDSLDAIGLSAQRLRQLSPTKQLEAIADGLNRIADPADRSRRGAEILGKAYLDLVPALADGAAGLRALITEQEKLGNTFTDEQIRRLADADDSVKRLSASWRGFATSITAFIAPELTELLDRLGALSRGEGLDTLEEKLRFFKNERNSTIPIVFNLGYDEGSGFVMGPGALDRRIAQIQAQIDKANLDRRVRAVSRGSGLAGQVAEETRRAREAAEQALEAAKKQAEAARKRQQALIDEATAHQRAREQQEAFVRSQITAIDPQQFEDTRFDQFGDSILESTQGIADQMSEIFKQPFDELSPYAEQAARNMQDAFADFLFDPFRDGLKGMLKGFIDIVRRMVAEAAAAKIFGSKKSGGLGLGDLITGAVGSLFGFAQGGSFTVGGSGGTDSQLVAFRATPGEKVSVRTPSQASGGMVNVYQNVDARGATVDAIKMLPAAMKAASDDAVARIHQQRKSGRI